MLWGRLVILNKDQQSQSWRIEKNACTDTECIVIYKALLLPFSYLIPKMIVR